MKGNQIAAAAQVLQPYVAKRAPALPAWRGFLHSSANHVTAWVDQSVVSATSFLALIMLGRWTDANQLGAYATAVSVLALLLAAQESLITRPYTIQMDQLPGAPGEHAFSSLVLSILLAVAATAVLSATAVTLSVAGAYQGLPAMASILAAATPFVLIREFARRFAFAHLKVFHVLIVDGAVAGVSVGLLCWLSWTGRLSAVTALGATGISCAIGSFGWFYVARSEFAFRFSLLQTTLKASWDLGKWLLSGQIALQVQGYGAYWLMMAISGATVTGIYAACMSIVSFANPMLFGFFNILTPKSIRALRSEGGAGLRRQAVLDSLLLVALMSPFCVFIVLAGENVMGFVYPGAEYQGHSQILTMLALSALASAIGVPASIALASAGHTRAVAGVMTFTAVLSVALVWALMTHWGFLGAAYAVLIAEVVGSLGRWISFLALVPGDASLNSDEEQMMQLTSTLGQTHRPMPLRKGDESGRILLRVFECLDRAGIRYCALHGYESFPQRTGSDVDCIIDSKTPSEQIYALLQRNRARINAEIVRCKGYYIVLVGQNVDSSPCFLTLDLTADCELDGVLFYAGSELLASRRRYREYWIPAAHLEFGCYLVRTVAKACLDDERTRKLSWLYRQDAARCQQVVARFWGTRHAELIVAAAQSNDWHEVRQHLASLREELRRRAVLRHPGRFVGNKYRGLVDRAKRVWQPDGLNVVLLGPDGAGKSTVIDGLGPRLHGAFARMTCSGFAPPLHRFFRRSNSPTNQPHALPSRSFLTSVVRAAYWFVYYTFGYVRLHLALARSTLVLNDRHFVDILVDRKRYRYGGPLWLLHLIWRVIPEPNLIIVLNAPPQVLQVRKQEVSFEETARQCNAYLALAGTLRNCQVVDASQPLECVTGEVSDIILRHLTMRIARRFGLAENGPRGVYQSMSMETIDAVPPSKKEK